MRLTGRGKRENYGKGKVKVDPNAVNSGGKDRENKRRALIRLLQKKPKTDKIRAKKQSNNLKGKTK